jgi:hypothetical protein
MQSKTMSLIESITSVILGYIIALITQVLVFPLFALDVSVKSHLGIGLIFTVVSLIRSYVLRRVYEKLSRKV